MAAVLRIGPHTMSFWVSKDMPPGEMALVTIEYESLNFRRGEGNEIVIDVKAKVVDAVRVTGLKEEQDG